MNSIKQLEEATRSMINWLSHPNEFGHSPFQIVCTHEFDKDGEHFYVFKFQKVIDSEWLVGVCGGYKSKDSSTHTGIVFSNFQEYSEETAIQHSIEIIEAIQDYWKREKGKWPTDEWFFKDLPQTAVYTTKSIVNKQKDVLIVFHDEEDGAWQFLDGGKLSKDEAMIISLEEMTTIDPTIRYLADMEIGYFAVREDIDSDWEIYKN